MTIYVLEVSHPVMEALPSARCRFEVCKQQCCSILAFLCRSTLRDRPQAQHEMAALALQFVDHIELFIKSTNDISLGWHQLKVRSFAVRMGRGRGLLAVTEEFEPDRYHLVPLTILLRVLSKLINVCLIKLDQVLSLAMPAISNSSRTIRLIPRQAAEICQIQSKSIPITLDVKLQVEAIDTHQTLVILTSKSSRDTRTWVPPSVLNDDILS